MWSLGVIFFMMLTGKPPFRGKNDDEIYDCVMIGEYQWPIEIQVSEQAKDLVAKLLTRDHTKRMTAAEALNHPWIANHETLSDVSLTAALKSIKDFSVAAKMKKAVAMLLIKELTPDETAKLYRLFDELDTDGDRLLDLAEMTLYMSQHGHEKPSDAQAAAKTFMDAADESKVLYLILSLIFLNGFGLILICLNRSVEPSIFSNFKMRICVVNWGPMRSRFVKHSMPSTKTRVATLICTS
jgi:calcium-dependent protein kinase